MTLPGYDNWLTNDIVGERAAARDERLRERYGLYIASFPPAHWAVGMTEYLGQLGIPEDKRPTLWRDIFVWLVSANLTDEVLGEIGNALEFCDSFGTWAEKHGDDDA